jgi:hypothetical protein
VRLQRVCSEKANGASSAPFVAIHPRQPLTIYRGPHRQKEKQMNDTAASVPQSSMADEFARDDDFFMPLENTKPFLKLGFEGFAGSGKTHTAAVVAIGLHRRIQSTKPIFIFDTEKSAPFLRGLFEPAGIRVLVKQSRSMADLRETMRRAREGASDILLIDSITHLWESFLKAYQEKNKKVGGRLEFQDWGIIKPTWKTEFSEPFVGDPYHAIFTGRAGYEYDNEVNEETKKREIFKVGVKMKVEGETAYEPDMLVLMERFEKVLVTEGKEVWREATILKDRTRLIDGKTIKNPTFDDFAPAVEELLRAPSNRKHIVERDAGMLFHTEEDKRVYLRQKDILLEKIEGAMVKAYPGQSAAEKKAKIEVLEIGFGTTSWREVETRSVRALEDGLGRLLAHLGQAAVERDQAVVGTSNPPAAAVVSTPAPAPVVEAPVDDPGPCGSRTTRRRPPTSR